ncbi:hypothetical protein ES332_A08G127200v1 [Gossypium tomentosum]|uniref:Enoyl reductase (ER) domain-containing protein n=1 Tax=Gossypium tomentosum TaxID=34277 RepID=A0A5D2PDR0_GOSTO|nr:hypothetical protein ES332_A08G127200v1 [Gossypium tomentosum]
MDVGYHSYETESTHTAGKVITCKAAVAWGPGQPLVIEDVQVAPPQKMEVRVKVLFTSICHTDLSSWKGENEAQRAYPRILGHEAAGIVESVGEGVEDMKIGDHVIPFFQGECGTCICCRSRKTNLCQKFGVNPLKSVMVNDGKTRFSTMDGNPIFHFHNTSTFSQYTVLDSACLVKIDTKAPLEKMSLLSCGVSTGVGAAWNVANVQPGSSVAIFGLGAVGLARESSHVLKMSTRRGASKIIGVDINPSKFFKGKAVGITEFINPKDLDVPVHEKIGAITEGGVDYSFECVGNLEVLREAFLSTHTFHLLLSPFIHQSVACIYRDGPMLLPLHPMELFNGRQIVGSIFGGFKGKTQLPKLAEQCM